LLSTQAELIGQLLLNSVCFFTFSFDQISKAEGKKIGSDLMLVEPFFPYCMKVKIEQMDAIDDLN